MSLEIMFLRHGKAARPEGVGDFDRPLRKKGKRQARKIGRWLVAHKALPDAVLSSSALRAVQTAEEVLKTAGLDHDLIKTDRRLYFDARANLMKALAGVDDAASRLLVVGHNPWMEDLVCDLASEPLQHPGGNWIMKTGTLIRFAVDDFTDGLGSGRGRLLDYVLPDTLPGADEDD
ncbi:MAG: histidine phosphatase family protein [Rhodospirillales bacterium]|nr:histidine phosphatase family protein [Rhodospirillales bacterium]MBO6787872.1 histidine phosphatase family protein [Rhodospirillales bacterium]